MEEKPIGIFDSGIGGLTVVKEIYEELPFENTLYFGDTAQVPYGSKSKEVVIKFSFENTRFLLKYGIKVMVVACNTVSALALDSLRKEFAVSIIGVIEPGVRAALKSTRNKRIGVIGTEATIKSNAYTQSLHSLNSQVKVFTQSCPLFVPLVEEGWVDKEVTQIIGKEYLNPLLKKNIDTLILGCTHYPLLEKMLREIVGHKVTLINSAREVAQEVKKELITNGLIRKKSNNVIHKFFVSDAPDKFKESAKKFLGKKLLKVEKVDFLS